tara:strand:- start:7698 stop:8396 length:699 start_codon:yes stop_codon:yes gene_type:complete
MTVSFNLEHFYKKTILVVGGGTSTLDRRWEDSKWDFLWTCNDFFLEERVLNQKVDLVCIGNNTDLTNKDFIKKVRKDKPFIFYEPFHYRGKELTRQFKIFQEEIGYVVRAMDLPFHQKQYTEGQKAGAAFRLIQLALDSNASHINFVGFDGFSKDFSNKHAFTKHVGLKPTDLRRDWKTGYYNVFTDAFKYFLTRPNYDRLQNFGEGLEYNLGSEISKKFFPLKEEIYDKIR